jgi:ribose transport system substrate-binding protein
MRSERSSRAPRLPARLALGAAAAGLALMATMPAQADQYLDQVKADIAAATKPVTAWDGPTSGPKVQPGKFIVYVAQSMTNWGSAGSAAGAKEAAAAIGWKYQIIDGQSTESANSAALEQAIALKPDGIILGALSAEEFRPLLQKAAAQGIKLVGWHASGGAGVDPADPEVFWNISTDPYIIAKTASEYVVAVSDGKAQSIIMTDPQYPIVRTKVKGETDALANCADCQILAVENCPFTEVSQRMPSLMNAMLQEYGSGLQYMLAHNDLFFDFAIPTLKAAGVAPDAVRMVSAGDGSESAYQRIRAGQYQIATVPEPTNLHGWMLIDELNRAFAGQQPSGYLTPVHLVTKENIDSDGGKNNVFDPDNGYRDAYKKIWGVQ